MDHSDYLRLLEWLEEPRPWDKAAWNRWVRKSLTPHDGVPNADRLSGRFEVRESTQILSHEERERGFALWNWEWRLRRKMDTGLFILLRGVCNRSFQQLYPEVSDVLVPNPLPIWSFNIKRVANPYSRFNHTVIALTGRGVLHDSQVNMVRRMTLDLSNRIKAVVAIQKPFTSVLN